MIPFSVKIHPINTRPDRWDGQSGSKSRSNKPYINFKVIRWAEYHRTNPSTCKGSNGYVGPEKFGRQIAAVEMASSLSAERTRFALSRTSVTLVARA